MPWPTNQRYNDIEYLGGRTAIFYLKRYAMEFLRGFKMSNVATSQIILVLQTALVFRKPGGGQKNHIAISVLVQASPSHPPARWNWRRLTVSTGLPALGGTS